MSNFLRGGLAIALASSTLAVGCGEENQPDEVAVRNISPQSLEISDNPTFYSYEHRRGALGIGQTAIARCIVKDNEFLNSSQLYIQYKNSEGYISPLTASTKASKGGKPQVSPSLSILEAKLPSCSDTNLGAK